MLLTQDLAILEPIILLSARQTITHPRHISILVRLRIPSRSSVGQEDFVRDYQLKNQLMRLGYYFQNTAILNRVQLPGS